MKILKAAKRVLQVNRTNSSIAIGRQREIESVEGIPYQYVPGPKPLPILGNSWRFIPFIGKLIFGLLIYHELRNLFGKEIFSSTNSIIIFVQF